MSVPEPSGNPGRAVLASVVEEALAANGSRRALVGANLTLRYDELSAAITRAAEELTAQWPGSGHLHLGFCLKNRPEYVVLYLGALAAGLRPFLLDESLTSGEIAAIRHDCGLDGLLVERQREQSLKLPGGGAPIEVARDALLLPLSRLAPAPFTLRSDTEVCRFTSGTTGRPKCIEFAGRAVLSAARNWVQGTGMGAEDRTLCLAALSNGLAFNTSLLATFLAGGELHFLETLPLTRPTAHRIAESAITRLVAFPTLYRNFAGPGGPEPAALISLRHAISAGAPLWSDVREEFRSRYALDISDYYGIAETGPCTFERNASHHSGLGQPLPGVEIRILDDGRGDGAGEILVRTASMASGYLNHPGLLEGRLDGDGFYRSGDRGQLIEGRLFLVGRTEDHINVAGRKIDPVEVAAVVQELAGVRDAFAFADEDLNRETLVHLAVVAADPALTNEAVCQACRARLAPFKVPGRISFVEEIPRNGVGKPRVALLREQLRSGATP